MALEVERKFLVTSEAWRAAVVSQRRYRQGYLARASKASVRVRSDGEHAWLNIKAAVAGTSRQEFDYPVPPADAQIILDQLCDAGHVEKTRYWVPYGDHTWEVDVFEGDNAGLVVAEIELSEAGEPFETPPWVGAEVTDDVRYYNNQLALYPYRKWIADD